MMTLHTTKLSILGVVLLLFLAIVTLKDSSHQEESNECYKTNADLANGHTSGNTNLSQRSLASDLNESNQRR